MPPKSANPEFQTLLNEIDHFYFTKEMEGFEALHHSSAEEAEKGILENGESSAHEVFAKTALCNTWGFIQGRVPLCLNLYINKVEDAIDEWIRGNKNYITSKEDLQNAFREFEKTEACKSIKPSILDNPLIPTEEKDQILMTDFFTARNKDEFPIALSLSFENKVMVHQQRELFRKLQDETFQSGSRENPTVDRKALEYGLEILTDRWGIASFTQTNCPSWGMFSQTITNAKNREQSMRWGKKLTNLFLEEDETLDENLEDEDKLFISAVIQFNSGSESGLLSKSAETAAKLEGKYIKEKRAGIKRVGKASLAWSIKRETTNMWKTKSEEAKNELKELEGTFSPFKKIIFSIQKTYYDRKAANSFEEERSAATVYERRYMNNDSGVLLAKQEYEKFCNGKHIVSGRNAQLGKEDLEEFSKLILNVSKASYDAKMTLGLNEDTRENSKNLWDKTNKTISQMVSQNAADKKDADFINTERYAGIKEMIETRFVEKEQVDTRYVWHLGQEQNTVDSAITDQTDEAPVEQQSQVLQPTVDSDSSN